MINKDLWTIKGTKHGINLQFNVVANVTEHGNFYVQVINQHGFTGYLYPDQCIRTRPEFSNKLNGYYSTIREAEQAVETFLGVSQMSSNVQQQIQDALDDMVQNEEMFTAFDVTTKIRNGNPGIQIFHSVVKQYVHDAFENGLLPTTYDRTLINVGNPQPWCYYMPAKHDPSQYGAVHTITTPVTTSGKQMPIPPKQTFVTGHSTPNIIKKVKDAVVATFGGITGGSR